MRRFSLILILFFLMPACAYAQGLIISPKRVVFDKGQRITEVLLANRGDTNKKYRISVVNRAMQENGQLIETQEPVEGEYFAKDYIRFSPRQTVLEAKQTQKIRIMSRLSADAPDGEYRSHLLIQEIPNALPAESAQGKSGQALGVNIQAIFGISIPIILRKGDLKAQVTLSDAKIVKINQENYLRLRVNRTGTKSILGTANIFTEDKKIGTLRNVAVYTSVSYREISIKIDPERAQNLSGKNIRITFGAEEENEDAPETGLIYAVP